VQTETANTGHSLLMLTKDGKAYSASIAAIQTTARQSKGTPLVTLLPATAQTDPETIVSQLILPSAPEDLEGLDLVLLTREGRIKRMPLSEFTNLTARGITALKLKENDELRFVRLTQAGEQLILATSAGRLLRLEVNDEQIPLMGRSAQGQQAMRLHKNEQLVDCITALQEDDLLLMTAQGDAKRIPVSTLKLMSRGGLGVQAIHFSSRSDTLAAVGLALPNGEVTVLTSDDRLAKLPIDKVPLLKRSDAGAPVLKLSKSEKVVRLFENEAIEPEEDAAGKSA
jgi:DNA gyrase subunit A